jgi:hypothetical protein
MTQYTYQLLPDYLGEPRNIIVRLPDHTFIPIEPGNRFYQEYLQWLDEGGLPLPPSTDNS